MILGIYHTSFVVSDLDRSVDFYCGLLGMKVMWRAESSTSIQSLINRPNSQIRLAFLQSGNGIIELQQFTADAGGRADVQPNQVRAAHLALFADDVVRTYQELLAQGVEFTSPPVRTISGRTAAMFRDPDGNAIELCQPLNPN